MNQRWIDEARRVGEGAEVPSGWQRIMGQRPPFLDTGVFRGLVAPLVAAVAWIGAVFRELVVGTPLDPPALLMRTLALAMTVRAFWLGLEVARRLLLLARARRSVLVLGPAGLWARLPQGEVAAERAEIVAICEGGSWRQGRAAGRRATPVYVVLASPLRTHIELPPLFDATPGVLAERLMRWRGAITPDTPPALPSPATLASKTYEQAARGIREPGTLVIPHGSGWLRRGPWATMLLGVAIVDGVLRASAEERTAIGITALVAAPVALVLAPAIWSWLTWRQIAPRLGLAMVLTPAELLLRTRSGVVRVGWNRVQRLSIDVRGYLSPIAGWALERALVIERRGEEPIRCDEAFLGVPAEVALGLCEAYVTGAAQIAEGVIGSPGVVAPSASLPEATARRQSEAP